MIEYIFIAFLSAVSGRGRGGFSLGRASERKTDDERGRPSSAQYRTQFYVLGYALLGACFVFCLRLGLIRLYRMYHSDKRPLEPFLAVAFAKLHNADPIKREREFARIGVGKDSKNLVDWADQIWNLFWFEDTDHFYNCNFEFMCDFIIKVAGVDYKVDSINIVPLMKKIAIDSNWTINIASLNTHKISKAQMKQYLRTLSQCKPPRPYYKYEKDDLDYIEKPMLVEDLVADHKSKHDITKPFAPREDVEDEEEKEEELKQLEESDDSVEIDPFSPRDERRHKKKRGSEKNKSSSKDQKEGREGKKKDKGVTQIIVNNYMNITLDGGQNANATRSVKDD